MLAEHIIDVKDSIGETAAPMGVDIYSGHRSWLFYLRLFRWSCALSV